MRTSTIIHCFGLLTIFTLFLLIGQFLFSTLAKENATGIYRVFPVTSLPLVAKKIVEVRHPELKKQQELEKPRSRVILHLAAGGQVEGDLLSETDQWILLNVDGSEVGFRRSEIQEIFRADRS